MKKYNKRVLTLIDGANSVTITNQKLICSLDLKRVAILARQLDCNAKMYYFTKIDTKLEVEKKMKYVASRLGFEVVVYHKDIDPILIAKLNENRTPNRKYSHFILGFKDGNYVEALKQINGTKILTINSWAGLSQGLKMVIDKILVLPYYTSISNGRNNHSQSRNASVNRLKNPPVAINQTVKVLIKEYKSEHKTYLSIFSNGTNRKFIVFVQSESIPLEVNCSYPVTITRISRRGNCAFGVLNQNFADSKNSNRDDEEEDYQCLINLFSGKGELKLYENIEKNKKNISN